MLNGELSMHITSAHRLNHGEIGWEFACDWCGYRARYYPDGRIQKLEILDAGDINARHLSSCEKGVLDIHTSVRDEDRFDNVEEDFSNWLTPEFRTKLDEILKDFRKKTCL